MLNLLEKWCEKRHLTIIYNILYILTDYSFLNENITISKILLSSKGYRIWELCFDLQDYEIMYQMVWILQNITYKDSESTYNLIKSNFFKNKILYFYNNGTILQHLNEKNPEKEDRYYCTKIMIQKYHLIFLGFHQFFFEILHDQQKKLYFLNFE